MNNKSILFRIFLTILLIIFTPVLLLAICFFIWSFWQEYHYDKYTTDKMSISILYPKKGTSIEKVQDDRENVKEHTRFTISDKSFRSDLKIDFLVINDEERKECDKCSNSDAFPLCDNFQNYQKYCPYFKSDYISEPKKGSYWPGHFGEYMGYISYTSQWNQPPMDEETWKATYGEDWPQEKTRKSYALFNNCSSEQDINYHCYFFAWFATGDKEAEKVADEMLKYGIEVPKITKKD